ncbi:hypothetical protein [Lacticaseibacillus sp. 53-4]|uniref:hypothetical protein n=1 Tax=Lacticaseibacillus sp. 53-4 TaxID=2799575 RepID=UPI001942C4A2|nr:hypothetical protein [Lacticaseibacillus sp. 53-4]
MKTPLTLDLEKTLYAYWEDLGAVAVEEVTMPADRGIVDTLVMQPGDPLTWRCFELKVTKSDFHSSAKLSFIGDYNYFVLPLTLYQQVADEIPAGIGVMTYQAFDPAAIKAATVPITVPSQLTISRPPRRQALQVPQTALLERFIASLNREVQKAKQVDKGLSHFSDEQLLAEIKRRSDQYRVYDPESNLYDRVMGGVEGTAVSTLQAEVDALAEELALLRQPS